MDKVVDVLLTLRIQFDVFHIEEVVHHCFISELVSKANLGEDLLRGLIPIQNSRRDRAFTWYMTHLTHLMLTWAIGLELASRLVFHRAVDEGS